VAAAVVLVEVEVPYAAEPKFPGVIRVVDSDGVASAFFSASSTLGLQH
jgi:hypothetical protein